MNSLNWLQTKFDGLVFSPKPPFCRILILDLPTRLLRKSSTSSDNVHGSIPRYRSRWGDAADAALEEKVRLDLLPNSKLTGMANLLVCPNLDSANIARNLLKVLGNGVTVGPLLLGLKKEAHVATASNSPRGIFNMAAVALANVNRVND